MNKSKTIGICILAITLHLHSFAQADKNSFSLKEAKEFAVQNSFLTKSSSYDSQIATQTIKDVRAMGLPQINAEGNFQNFINLPVSLIPSNAFGFPDYLIKFLVGLSQATGVPLNAPAPNPSEFTQLKFGTNYNINGGITLNQLLFDGSYFYGLQAAKVYAEMYKIQEQKTAEDVVLAVEKAYYMAIIAAENIQLLETSKKSLDNIFNQTKEFNKAGFVEAQDVEQIQLNLSTFDNTINTAKLQQELALNMLKFQMGYDMAKSITITDNIEALMSDASSFLLKTDFNPQGLTDFKLLDYREKLLTLNKKSEKSKIYPRLVGYISHTENTFMNKLSLKDNPWFPTTLWGLKLQVPIFNGGGHQATMKKVNIELTRIKEAKLYSEQGLQLQYASAKTEFNAAYNEQTISKKNLELAEKIKNKTDIKFSEGVSSSMDLTQAQNQYLSAQGNYINSLFKLLNAKANLQKLTK